MGAHYVHNISAMLFPALKIYKKNRTRGNKAYMCCHMMTFIHFIPGRGFFVADLGFQRRVKQTWKYLESVKFFPSPETNIPGKVLADELFRKNRKFFLVFMKSFLRNASSLFEVLRVEWRDEGVFLQQKATKTFVSLIISSRPGLGQEKIG